MFLIVLAGINMLVFRRYDARLANAATDTRIGELAAVESASSYKLFFDKIERGNQTTPGKPYPNTTEAGFMKVNDTPAASGSLSDILPFRRPTGRQLRSVTSSEPRLR
jgi:hypothetical protein